MIHIEEAQEFLGLLEVGEPNGGEESILFNQSTIDPAAPDSSDFKTSDFMQVEQIVTQTNSHDELCDIWLGKCPLVSIVYVKNLYCTICDVWLTSEQTIGTVC